VDIVKKCAFAKSVVAVSVTLKKRISAHGIVELAVRIAKSDSKPVAVLFPPVLLTSA
jgi:hypothetical protein